MEAANIKREIIAQSKGDSGVHLAFAFPNSSARMSLTVHRNNLLFVSKGDNGKKLYHVVTTKSNECFEFKYSSADGAIALLAAYDQHLSQGRFYARVVVYKKGDPNLVQLTTNAVTLEKSDQDDELWEKGIKSKLRLLDELVL